MKLLPRYRLCFVCGRDNDAGLDIQFFRDGPRVFCDWVPAEKHLGYRDRVHGGVTASILDEAMGWAPASELKSLCYSVEISVKYRGAIPCGKTYRVEAEVVESRSRRARTEGRILDAAGAILASASGLYVPVPQGMTVEILSHLYLEGTDRPVTADDF